MTAAKRKVLSRLLILAANVATIAVILEVATVSPIRAVLLVAACLLVTLVLERRDVATFIHRVTGR